MIYMNLALILLKSEPAHPLFDAVQIFIYQYATLPGMEVKRPFPIFDWAAPPDPVKQYPIFVADRYQPVRKARTTG